MNSSQQQFVNKGKKASVKNPNTEADPVPFALFWSEFLQECHSKLGYLLLREKLKHSLFLGRSFRSEKGCWGQPSSQLGISPTSSQLS
jgi:hypothetical protein